MSNTVKLKLCPFCKITPRLDTNYYNNTLLYYVSCSNFNCTVNPMTELFDTMKKAIEAWRW